MVTLLKFIIKQMFWQGKGIQKTSKIIPESIPKSMNNQCTICIRKSDATNIEYGIEKGTQNHDKPINNR